MRKFVFFLFLVCFSGVAISDPVASSSTIPSAENMPIDTSLLFQLRSGVGNLPQVDAVIVQEDRAIQKILDQAIETERIAKRNNISFSMNFFLTEDYYNQLAAQKDYAKTYKINLLIGMVRTGITAHLYYVLFPGGQGDLASLLIARQNHFWAKPGRWNDFQLFMKEKVLGKFVSANWISGKGMGGGVYDFASRIAVNTGYGTASLTISNMLLSAPAGTWDGFLYGLIPNAIWDETFNRWTHWNPDEPQPADKIFSRPQNSMLTAARHLFFAFFIPYVQMSSSHLDTIDVVSMGISTTGIVAFLAAPKIVDWSRPYFAPVLEKSQPLLNQLKSTWNNGKNMMRERWSLVSERISDAHQTLRPP